MFSIFGQFFLSYGAPLLGISKKKCDGMALKQREHAKLTNQDSSLFYPINTEGSGKNSQDAKDAPMSALDV